MSGRRSRNKGARTERAIVRLLRGQGFVAEKISGMYKPGADLRVPLLAVERTVEVKCRAAGFHQLYDWLNGRDVLIIRADRRELLVVVRSSLAAELQSWLGDMPRRPAQMSATDAALHCAGEVGGAHPSAKPDAAWSEKNRAQYRGRVNDEAQS
jgi:hypothetical protein